MFIYFVDIINIYELKVLNDPSKACNLAKQAFDDAIANIEDIEED